MRSRGLTPKMLIARVGYRKLRDVWLGPVLMDGLMQEAWPPGVEIDGLSYGAVAVMHRFDDRGPYDRLILIGGVRRGREPGGVYRCRWEHPRRHPEEVRGRVVEAVTGLISLDNLLIIATYFGKLPRDVVSKVGAAGDGWGEGFTPQVERASLGSSR